MGGLMASDRLVQKGFHVDQGERTKGCLGLVLCASADEGRGLNMADDTNARLSPARENQIPLPGGPKIRSLFRFERDRVGIPIRTLEGRWAAVLTEITAQCGIRAGMDVVLAKVRTHGVEFSQWNGWM
jgi:hypothetical protein